MRITPWCKSYSVTSLKERVGAGAGCRALIRGLRYAAAESGALSLICGRNSPNGASSGEQLEVTMPKDPGDDRKRDALANHRVLHPRPERVTDELFVANAFFDPRDLIQVKYEMLRRVRADEQSVSEAAARFGLSRPTFYEARAAFQRAGLRGLLPAKKGPRRRHKLSESVMAFVDEQLAADASVSPAQLARRIEEHFGLTVHPRSVSRALARRARKAP